MEEERPQDGSSDTDIFSSPSPSRVSSSSLSLLVGVGGGGGGGVRAIFLLLKTSCLLLFFLKNLSAFEGIFKFYSQRLQHIFVDTKLSVQL